MKIKFYDKNNRMINHSPGNSITKKIKTMTCYLLTAALLATAPTPVWAITKAEKEKQEAQKKLDEAQRKAQEAESSKNTAQRQVNAMGDELTDLLSTIEILESDLANKESEIKQAEIDLQEAKAKEESQYQAMKKRIKFIYEKGDTEYLDVLLQVESMSDLLNKTEYVQELYNYDKKMLTAFQETKLQVQELKSELEEEKVEMEVIEEQYKEQQENLEVLIAKKRKEVTNFDAQLAQAKKDAAIYTKSIEAKTAQIKKEQEAAKKKAEEARKKAEAAARQAAAQQSASNSTKPKDPFKTNNSSSGSGAPVKSSGGTAAGRAVADYGLQFVGNPYVYGGNSLTNGADCSGFTKAVYANFGVNLPRTSSEQARVGQAVSYDDMQPGDLVHYAGHIAIYIGNGQIVHASSAKTGIKTSNVGYRAILGIRRVL